jgi:hypothetical protein
MTAPTRLDRLQTGIYEALSAAVPSADVSWAGSHRHHDPTDHITLSVLGGPGPSAQPRRHGVMAYTIETAVFTITNPPIVGGRIGLTLNGHSYIHDPQGGETSDDIRDIFVANINAGEPGRMTAAARVGLGELDLAADYVGGVMSAAIWGGIVASDVVKYSTPVLLSKGNDQITINVQAYSKGREPFNGAHALISQVSAGLASQDILDILGSYEIGVSNMTHPLDLSNISGSRHETRASMDVRFNLPHAWTRAVNAIKSVETTANIRDQNGDIILNIEDTTNL